MSRLTSPLLASLLTIVTLALAGCPSSASTVNPQTTPSPSTQPVTAPVPLAPPPRLTDQERDFIDSLIIAMYVDDHEVRRLAAEELGTIGADARKALPELIHCAAAFDEKDEPIASCAHSIVLIASGSDAHGITALVYEFQLPLETKERALAAIGDLGGLATPALASIYLDACNRRETAATVGAADHLTRTANLALAQMARSPASAKTYLSDERHGECGVAGIEAVGVIASR